MSERWDAFQIIPLVIRFPKKDRNILPEANNPEYINIYPCAFKKLDDSLKAIQIYEGRPVERVTENLPGLMTHGPSHYHADGM